MTDVTVPEALWTRLVEALGLPVDTIDPETVVLATEDLVTSPAPNADAVAAAAGLDPGALDQLRHDAEQGRVLKAAARKREIGDKVRAAVTRGSITPARSEHWMTAIEADPAMADTLASLPNELAVPLSEAGHGQDNDGTAVVETAAWFY